MPVNTGQTIITSKGVIDVGAIGIVGSVLGMPIEMMVMGALAGAFANWLSPPAKRRSVLVSVAASMFLAGVFAPLLAHWVSFKFDIVPDTALEVNLLNGASAAIVGGGWAWFMPLLDDGVKRIWSAVVTAAASAAASAVSAVVSVAVSALTRLSNHQETKDKDSGGNHG